ncbi:BOP1NT-domain-containing protein [Ramaria rubella]|nr:BOP1NT-domain-containing protein [Ramaria rubella]
MAIKDKKRKRDVQTTDELPGAVILDMSSDDERDQSGSEDDGHSLTFPELDTESDSEDDGGNQEADSVEDTVEEEDNNEGELSEGEDNFSVFPLPKTIISHITGEPKRVYPSIEPDYDSDSSTENAPNRVGNIPMHWYDDLPHVGYDVNGKKVLRPARGDELDKFLETVEDPLSWTTALDRNTQSDKPLSAEELDIIRRLRENEIPDSSFDPYEVFLRDEKPEVMPLSGAPEPKRRWVPSKWEKQKVMKIVRAIRQGRILPAKPKSMPGPRQFYSLWTAPADSSAPAPLAAPKIRLPTHAESYNPPPEYLPDPKAPATVKDEDDKSFTPKSYSALRLVPAYDRFINERFDRLLDLYLAPRVQRRRLPQGVTKADDLIPQLPDPKALRPFPTYRALRHLHQTRVRAVSVSPGGDWVISADDIGEIRLWEVLVGREVKTWRVEGKVSAVSWCPRKDVAFFLVGVDGNLHAFVPPSLHPAIEAATLALLAPATVSPPPENSSPIAWTSLTSAASGNDAVLTLQLPPLSGLPKQITWHRRGDYFASVSGKEGQGSVWIHQLSKRHSQAPFRKIKGSVQLVLFHPHKPHFFVATQRYVRVYDLSAQQLLRTLMPGLKWISSMDVHPSGDHLIVGGYDRKLCWFDLELSEKPYKVLRYHSRALRSIAFHPSYPLFASASDDGTIQVFHARVFSDLLTDPLIVPLKILRGHTISDGLGVLEVRWCPGAPWLISAGADGLVDIWQ